MPRAEGHENAGGFLREGVEKALAVEGEEVAGGEEGEGGEIGQCVPVRGGRLFKLNAKVPVVGSEGGGREGGRVRQG